MTHDAKLQTMLSSGLAHTRDVATRAVLDLGQLDVLGRVPVPLRLAFASGLARSGVNYRAVAGKPLKHLLLKGSEWYRPFDVLARAQLASEVPSMLITTLQQDVMLPQLLAHYTPPRGANVKALSLQRSLPEPLTAAGIFDAQGIFNVFGVVPFVCLVDERRLAGRPLPRTWSDLLDPMWSQEIVFGGHRTSEREPYSEYNGYLLECMHWEFGDAGLRAFAHNVSQLQHTVKIARLFGSNSLNAATIAVLPWLQAQLCPRRKYTRIVWPEDGAWMMPMAYLVQPSAAERLQPVVDYLNGAELAGVLDHNAYPAVGPGAGFAGLPRGARLKWPGWDYFRDPGMPQRSQHAARVFFEAKQAWDERRESGHARAARQAEERCSCG